MAEKIPETDEEYEMFIAGLQAASSAISNLFDPYQSRQEVELRHASDAVSKLIDSKLKEQRRKKYDALKREFEPEPDPRLVRGGPTDL